MPLIGQTRILEPGDFSSIAAGERLSQTKEGRVIASKGTLSDGLYPIWAHFCPNQAHEQNRAFLKQIIGETVNLFEKSVPIRNQALTGATILKFKKAYEPFLALTETLQKVTNVIAEEKQKPFMNAVKNFLD